MPVIRSSTKAAQAIPISLGLPFFIQHLQTVAEAANRCDLERMPVLGKSLAQAVDMDVQGSVVAVKIVTPDILDQLLTGKGTAWVTGQLEQQLEFLERKGEALAVDHHFKGFAVHGQFPDLDRLRGDDPIAFQQGVNARHQFQGLEGLDQIVVGGFELLAQLPAVHVRHHHINNCQIYFNLIEFCQGIHAIRGLDDLEPVVVQKHLDKFANMGVVVDNQYFAHPIRLHPRVRYSPVDLNLKRIHQLYKLCVNGIVVALSKTLDECEAALSLQSPARDEACSLI